MADLVAVHTQSGQRHGRSPAADRAADRHAYEDRNHHLNWEDLGPLPPPPPIPLPPPPPMEHGKGRPGGRGERSGGGEGAGTNAMHAAILAFVHLALCSCPSLIQRSLGIACGVGVEHQPNPSKSQCVKLPQAISNLFSANSLIN